MSKYESISTFFPFSSFLDFSTFPLFSIFCHFEIFHFSCDSIRFQLSIFHVVRIICFFKVFSLKNIHFCDLESGKINSTKLENFGWLVDWCRHGVATDRHARYLKN